MPTRLHLENGAAPTNYRFRAELPSTAVSLSDALVGYQNAEWAITQWGRPYPYTGWSEYVIEWTEPTSGAVETICYLDSVLCGIMEQYPGLVSRLEVDGWELVATECSGWLATFTALRWYVDGVLRFEMPAGSGPYTYIGYNYDQRENKTRGQSTSGITEQSFTPTFIGCEQGDKDYEGSCTGRAGWQWDNAGTWKSEPITEDTGMALPATTPPGGCPACSCAGTLPAIAGTDSWTVDTQAEYSYVRTSTHTGSTTCVCTRTGEVFTLQRYRTQVESKTKTSYVDIEAQANALLHKTRRYRTAGCTCRYPLDSGDYTIADATVVEAVTYCPSYQYTERWTTDEYCDVGIRRCPEPPFGEPPDQAVCGPIATPVLCYYRGYVQLSWPDWLCGGTCCPSVDVSKSGRWYHAFIKTATNAVVTGNASSSFLADRTPIAWQDFDAGFVADSVCIRYDKLTDSPRLWIVYDDGGTIYRRSSNNHGETWSMSSTIAAGENPTHDPIESGRRYVYWGVGTAVHGQVFDHEWNTVIAAFTATGVSIDSGTKPEVKVHSGGSGQLVIVLTYTEGGNVKTAYSFDAQAFT